MSTTRSAAPSALAGTSVFCVAMLVARTHSIWLTTSIAASLSLLLAFTTNRTRLTELLRFDVRALLHGLVGGVALALLSHLAFALGTTLWSGFPQAVSLLYEKAHQSPGPLVGLPLLMIVVLAEEVIWRGLLFDAARQRMAPTAAALVATTAYALPQVFAGQPLLLVLALLLGSIWSIQRIWTNGLLAPLTTHFLWDLLILVVFPLPLR